MWENDWKRIARSEWEKQTSERKSMWCRRTFSAAEETFLLKVRIDVERLEKNLCALCEMPIAKIECVCAFSIALQVVHGERQIRMDEISSWISRPSSLWILDGGKVEICCYFLSFIRQLISWLLSACLASIVQGLHSGCLATSLPPVQSLLLSPCATLTPPYTSAGGAKRKISVHDLKRKCS